MDKKSKLISGLKSQKSFQKSKNYFTEEEKKQIIKEYLLLGCTKREIWEKYTGKKGEHGQILEWMRRYGYDTSVPEKRPKFDQTQIQMNKIRLNQLKEESLETLLFKRKIEELEKKLQDAEMKAVAFSMMVDLAEKEFNIPIRKKFNTKPSEE